MNPFLQYRWWSVVWIVVSVALSVLSVLSGTLEWGSTRDVPHQTRTYLRDYSSEPAPPRVHYERFALTASGSAVADTAEHVAGALHATTSGTVDASGALVFTTEQTLLCPLGSIPDDFTLFIRARYASPLQNDIVVGASDVDPALVWYAGWHQGQVGVSNWDGVTQGGATDVTATEEHVVAVRNLRDTLSYSYQTPLTWGTSTFKSENVSTTAEVMAIDLNYDGTTIAVFGDNTSGGGNSFLAFYKLLPNNTWHSYVITGLTDQRQPGRISADGNTIWVHPHGANYIREYSWTGSGWTSRDGNAFVLSSNVTTLECSYDGTLQIVGGNSMGVYQQNNMVYSAGVTGAGWTNGTTAGTYYGPMMDRQTKLAFGASYGGYFYSWHRANTSTTEWTALSTSMPGALRAANGNMTRFLQWYSLDIAVTFNTTLVDFDATQAAGARFTTVATLSTGDKYNTGGMALNADGTQAVHSRCTTFDGWGADFLFRTWSANNAWTKVTNTGSVPNGSAHNGCATISGDGSVALYGCKSNTGSFYLFRAPATASVVSSRTRTWVDGVAVPAGASPSRFSGNTAHYQLGINLGSSPSACALRELRVYDSHLSDADIEAVSLLLANAVVRPHHISYGSAVGFVDQPLTVVATCDGNAPNSVTCETLVAPWTWSPTTGSLTGTPTEATNTTHTVVWRNDAGDTSVNLALRIYDAPVVAYAQLDGALGESVSVAPSLLPSDVTWSNFAISPDLPEGLSLDVDTGEIRGTPTVLHDRTEYVVTASVTGYNLPVTSNTWTLAVTSATPPAGFGYGTTPSRPAVWFQNYPDLWLNSAQQRLMPINAEDYTGWTVHPALPSGLNLDQSTGTISGVPDTETPTQGYAVTAHSTKVDFNFTETVYLRVLTTQLTQLQYADVLWVPVGLDVTFPPTLKDGAALRYALGDHWFSGFQVDSEGVVNGRLDQGEKPRTNATVTFDTFRGRFRSNPMELRSYLPLLMLSSAASQSDVSGAGDTVALQDENTLTVGDVVTFVSDVALSDCSLVPDPPSGWSLTCAEGQPATLSGTVQAPQTAREYTLRGLGPDGIYRSKVFTLRFLARPSTDTQVSLGLSLGLGAAALLAWVYTSWGLWGLWQSHHPKATREPDGKMAPQSGK